MDNKYNEDKNYYEYQIAGKNKDEIPTMDNKYNDDKNYYKNQIAEKNKEEIPTMDNKYNEDKNYYEHQIAGKNKEAMLTMDNKYNEDKNYYEYQTPEKNKEKPTILFFDPEWVGLGRIKVRSDGTKVFDPIFVPENLVDDINKGNIDPEKYSKEELRRMSLRKQELQNPQEEYDKKKYTFDEIKKNNSKDYDNDDIKKIFK